MNIVIMTCRNGLELSKECYKTLQAQSIKPLIFVVDNNSSDGTLQWLRATTAEDPSTITLFTTNTLSVSTMWNLALMKVWNWGASQALVVNNDTELLPETYQVLLDYADQHPEAGLVTAVPRLLGESMEYDEITIDPHPHFSCYLIKRSAWEAIGGFDEKCIGAYVEDCVAHVEMHRHGIRAVRLSLPFLHKQSGTLRYSTEEEAAQIRANADHNRQYFLKKYGVSVLGDQYATLFTEDSFGSALR